MKWRGFLAQKFYGVSPTTAGSSVSTTKPADDVIDANPFRASVRMSTTMTMRMGQVCYRLVVTTMAASLPSFSPRP